MASTSIGGEPGPGVNATTPLPFGDRERDPVQGSSETAARIDRYALLRVLGGGGMGVVYAAYDEHLDRKVALKVLSERNTIASAADRMHREAQALARLSHPNVVGVHDVGISEGRVFMAMEFISGQTLRTWLRAERRSHGAILRVFVEAGRGLAAAHAAGIVHRDFKPDNVMVGDDGRVRVFDFGLARPTGSTSEQELDYAAAAAHEALGELAAITATGTILGTPGYMSPEQHMGRPADARSDIYALCVSLYEAFYGQRPFVGETHSMLANAVIRGEYQTPPRGVIPPRMRKIIRRGLDVDPGARWQSMEALLSALTDDPVRRRRRVLLLTAAVFTLLTLIAVAPTVALKIYDRWQSERHERIAEERWRSTAAQIESIDALADERQRAAESQRIFNTFASAVDHRGTRALTKAWIERGAAARQSGDAGGAYGAYAQAYANANDAGLTRQALLELAELALTRRDWPSLGTLLAELDDRPREGEGPASARLVELRLQHAIATRSASLGEAPSPAGSSNEQAALAKLVAPLTQGRRLSYRISAANLADTDDDGVDELILVSDDLHAVVVLDRELRLLLRHELPAGLGHALPVPGRPLVLTYGDAHLRLHRVGDRFDEVWRAPAESHPYAAVSGDLDGDGSDDLYVGLAAYRRGLHVVRRAAGEAPRLEVAEPSIDASRSDINAVEIADLDGDGAPELIAALGPWHAYDLRILRPGGEGLEPVDRVQLGNVVGLAVLHDSQQRPLLAALKDDRWPNRRVFPAAPHTGEPAGVYLYAFDGEHLLPRGYVDPLADFATPARNFPGDLLVGDFDGDGLDDLVLNANTDESALGRMMIVLRQGERGFSPARLLGLHAFAVAELDDDPEPELIVRDYSEVSSFWAIGLADQALPPPYPALPAARVPEGLTDDIRDGWRRAERLASIGLAEAAASALQATALRSEPGPQRRATEARAAELYATAGDDLRALTLYRADEPRGSPADVDAAPSLIRLGRYDEAARALLRADPDAHLPDQLRPTDLQHIVDAAPRSRLTFESPLAPSWEILDPLAVRRDPSSDTLRVQAARKSTPIARLPLLWDGGPLVLKAAFAVVHSEFAGALDVSIRAGDGERIAGFWVNTIGGAEVYEHQLGCLTHNRDDGSGLLLAAPSEAIGQRFEHTLTLTIIPSRGASTCRLDAPLLDELHSSLPEALPAGPYTLEITTGGRNDDAGTHITVDFQQIELRGATLSAPLFADAASATAAAGARLLADGETAAALATLATIDDAPAEIELWRALAHVRRGDLRSSREALATNLELDPRPPAERPDLRRLLRLAPELAPLLREALQGSFTELLLASWAGTIGQHPDDPYVTQTLIEELERLGITAEDPHAALLLAARGRAWHHIGEPKRALVDLLAAEAHARDSADQELLAEIAVSLARLHLELADPASAEASLGLALSLSRTPDLLLEILLRDPALAPVLEARSP